MVFIFTAKTQSSTLQKSTATSNNNSIIEHEAYVLTGVLDRGVRERERERET